MRRVCRRAAHSSLSLALAASLLIVITGSAQAAGGPKVLFERPFEGSISSLRQLDVPAKLQLREPPSAPEISHKPSKTEPYTPCPSSTRKGTAECGVVIEPKPEAVKYGFVEPGGGPLLEGSGEGGAWSAKDLQEAYKIATTNGEGLTVAIVDAYGYETANADLKKYRETYGLPPCLEEPGKESACFRKVNQKGEEGSYPAQGPEGWRLETALDLDMVSAACPKCRILLVQSDDALIEDLAAAVETAVKLGAVAVSNSYGTSENNGFACPKEDGCTEFNSAYKHPGIPIVVSAGDSGFVNEYEAIYGLATPSFPASSPDVISVGGTELEKAENSRGWSEHVWAPSGGGCSQSQTKPSWQTDPGCAKRMGNDVAAVAEGVSVRWNEGWWRLGGTSVSAPLIAGIEATQSKAVREEGAQAFYKRGLYDVSTGFNGVCRETYLCGAQEGYDGPTGWGTPVGTLSTLSGLQVRTGVAKNAPGPASTKLTGYVYPGGKSSSYYFQYGATESYGTNLPASPVSVGSGTLWQPAAQEVTASLPLGTYHYRLVATNGSETLYGKDHTFTTTPWTDRETPNHNELSNDLFDVSCSSSSACTAVGYGHESPKTNDPFYVSSFSSKGSGEGQLSEPSDMAFTFPSGEGRVMHVLDSGNNRIEMFKPVTGEYLGKYGSGGSGAGQLSNPRGMGQVPTAYLVFHGGSRDILVADTGNNRVVRFNDKQEFVLAFGKDVNKTQVEKGGTEAQRNVCTAASGDICQVGKAGSANGQLSAPEGAAVDYEGNVWVADTGNGRLQVFTLAGEFVKVVGSKGSGEGQLGEPGHLTIFGSWVLIADHDNRVEIFERSGAFVRQFGSPGSGNGQFSNPGDVDMGKAGNIWVTDTGNNRVEIFTPSGKYIRQLGSKGSGEGQFSGPIGVAVETNPVNIESFEESEIFVTDGGNGRVERFLLPSVVPIAQRWDGSKWTAQSTPALIASNGYLNDVSCPSASSCTAVGYTRSRFGPSGFEPNLPLIEHWDGTKWEVQAAPSPPFGLGEAELEGVSCPTTSYCIAVGWGETSEREREAFVEQWDGKEWTIMPTPEPTGPGSEYLVSYKLTSVSCTLATSCTAVGWGGWITIDHRYTLKTLIEHWDGTKWTVQSSPNPGTVPPEIAEIKGSENELQGVSCVSTSACTAVGSYTELIELEEGVYELKRKTLALKWDGSKWSQQSTPEPSGVTYNGLEDVSCISAESCIATDFAWESLTFAYSLRGGTWSVHETNEHSGGGELRMWGVACTASNACMAVGGERPTADVERTLARVLSLPSSETETATSVKATEATLNGSINPSGINTSYQFQYGTTTAYGKSVPVSAEAIGSGTEAVKVQKLASGLAPNTLYHYRVIAKSGSYEEPGKDQTFTTKAITAHWFACTKQTGGRYTNNKCATDGSPNEYESLKLKEAEKTTIKATGNPLAITATLGGVKGTINCETEVTNASLENPSGGGNGIGNAELKFKGCKAEGSWWSTCKVTPGATVAEKLALSTLEGKSYALLSAKEGTTIASFTLAECAIAGTYNLAGYIRGLYSNANSKVEFTSESTAEGATLGGNKATAVGSIKLETSAGGYVSIQGAPVAKTEAASSIQPSEATLNGTVNPEGADAHYQFEYGKTTSYGQLAPAEAKDAGEGLTDVKVSETIKGLVAGTLYHFRLSATNGVSTSYGADKTFTTTTNPLHWFACTKQGGGKYKDGKCASEGSPNEWESVVLKEATKTTIVAKGNPLAVTATLGGVKGTINCETEVSNASLENPSGAGNGTGNAELKFKGCKAESGWSTCKVTPGATVAEKLALSTLEGKSYALLSAKEGTTIASFTISECALAGTYNLAGYIRGLYSNANSKVEFTSETTAEGPTLGANKATVVGSIGLETTGGGYIRAE